MMSKVLPAAVAGTPPEIAVRAVGFRVAGWDLATPVGLLSEVWSCPRLAVVPHTEPWLLGVANYRGRLLTVVDLSGYVAAQPARRGLASRLLVVDRDPVLCGLLVDEVHGLKRMPADRDPAAPIRTSVAQPGMPPRLQAGTAGCWQSEGARWWYWDPSSLIAQPEFARAAASPASPASPAGSASVPAGSASVPAGPPPKDSGLAND